MTRYVGNTASSGGLSAHVWVDVTNDGSNTGTQTNIHYTYGIWFSFSAPDAAPVSITWADNWGGHTGNYSHLVSSGDHTISGPNTNAATIIYGGGNSIRFRLSTSSMGVLGASSAEFDYPLPARTPVVPTWPGTNVDSITSSSARILVYPPGSNGGAGIDGYEAYILTNNYWPNAGGHVVGSWSGGTGTGTGLARATMYFYTARAHNAAGWSPWSTMGSFRTLATVPDAPGAAALSSIAQSTVVTVFNGNSNGGAAITRWELGYGTSPTTPQTVVTSPGTLTITGLTPGTGYYFWSRGVNSIGTGPWSVRSTATTLPGVHLRVSGVWVSANPHNRVAGAWVGSRTHGRISGAWS